MRKLLVVGMLAAMSITPGHAAPAAATAPSASPSSSPFANGKKNYIIAAGATRIGATFSFPQVQSESAGWLVLYRIVDGIPQGDAYVGATYVPAGHTQNVQVKVNYTPTAGEHLVVMLHHDANRNKTFDFTFDDKGRLTDDAVIENRKMVARIFAVP